MASNLRYTIPRKFLLGVLLATGTIDGLRVIGAGPVSAMGMLTLVTAGATWLMWADRPSLSQLFGPLLPIILFCVYLLAGAPFLPPTVQGVQPLIVLFAFAGCLALAMRETAAHPEFARQVNWMIERAFWLSVGLYILSLLGVHVHGEDLIGFRAAALYFLIPLGHFLGRWRAGEKWPVVVCLLILGMMFQSMSRMALVAGTLMVPLAVMLRGDRKALFQTIVIGSVLCGALAAGIMFYQPMYDRFFKEDASLQVGGVSINATGRTYVWGQIIDSYWNHPIVGQGAGSTGIYTNKDGMDHPHNDYLRIVHDHGIIGLGLFVAGLGAIAIKLLQNALRARQAGRITQPIHVAALCALFGICCTMFSDNPVSYIYVMGPLGVLLGTSLGLGEATAREPSMALGGEAGRSQASAVRRGMITQHVQSRRRYPMENSAR